MVSKPASKSRKAPSETGRCAKIFIDGAARGNPGPAGAGIIISPGGSRKPIELFFYLGETTNNVAETAALILALQEVLKRGEKRVEVCTDSELLANQVNGVYRVRDKNLQSLHVLVRNLTEGFDHFSIRHVPREENRHADKLANKAVSEGLKKQLRPVLQARQFERTPADDSQQPTFW